MRRAGAIPIAGADVEATPVRDPSDESKLRDRTGVIAVILLWVLSSNLFNASSKQVSTNNPWTAFATTTTQLAGTSLLGVSAMRVNGRNFQGFFEPLKQAAPVGVGLALANGSMMWALSRTSIGMFQTVKASSPLFTALACHLVLGRRYTLATYLTLIPVMLGLAAASATDLEADVLGVAACILSSVCQVFVNLSAKHMLEKAYPELDSVDSKPRFLQPFELQSLVSVVGFCTCFTALMTIALGSVLNQIYTDGSKNAAESGGWDISLDHLLPPLNLLFWNVVLYSTENVLAYTANGKLPRLPFAVVDAVRRLSIVISFNVILADRKPSTLNLIGVVAVAVGSVCFSVVVEER